MTATLRFLILTSDAGFGHRRAANAVTKSLKIQHPQQVDIQIVNPILEHRVPNFIKTTEKHYDENVIKRPHFYQGFFKLSDSRSASKMIEVFLGLMLKEGILNLIKNFKPHAILNTKEVLNAPIGRALQQLNSGIPFFTLVTELAEAHALWFNPNPDHFFIASESIGLKAKACGINPNKITLYGIPVDPVFGAKREPQKEIRRRLGLDLNLPALLFVSSQRVHSIFQHLQTLERMTQAFQVAVITGGNHELYTKIQEKEWSFPILIKKFVDNIPEWMFASNILITKAGGMILSEGLAAGLPIILIDHLPGQEEGNVHFIVDNKAGEFVKNSQDFYRLVNSWLQDNMRNLNFHAENARRLGKPDAAAWIAEALWSAAAQYSQI